MDPCPILFWTFDNPNGKVQKNYAELGVVTSLAKLNSMKNSVLLAFADILRGWEVIRAQEK